MTLLRTHARPRALAVLLAGALLVAAPGCGPVSLGDSEAAETADETPLTAPRAEAEQTAEDPLAGTWWVLAKDLPLRGLRMNIAAADDPEGAHAGHWVSFDWRATSSEDRLVRRSRPVEVTVRREGELYVIEGPSPMLTDRGEPNGRRGSWRLEVRRTNMPGEPLRLSGRAVHSELTDPAGVPVDLERTLRIWTRN
jgi:hypothetical protein